MRIRAVSYSSYTLGRGVPYAQGGARIVKEDQIGIIVSVICAVPATLAYILTTEIRQLRQGHITVIDAA